MNRLGTFILINRAIELLDFNTFLRSQPLNDLSND